MNFTADGEDYFEDDVDMFDRGGRREVLAERRLQADTGATTTTDLKQRLVVQELPSGVRPKGVRARLTRPVQGNAPSDGAIQDFTNQKFVDASPAESFRWCTVTRAGLSCQAFNGVCIRSC